MDATGDPKNWQRSSDFTADVRGGGSTAQCDKSNRNENRLHDESIDDLLKPPTPWSTPEKQDRGTPKSVKTSLSLNINEVLRTPRTPATPI